MGRMRPGMPIDEFLEEANESFMQTAAWLYGKCEWKYKSKARKWITSCDSSFTFSSASPKSKDFIYCPFCGHRIDESK